MLADMGAEVVRVDRVTPSAGGLPEELSAIDLLNRGRRSIAVDLKSPAGVEIVLSLAEHADAMFEPFRPGVAERLGIGPERCLIRNPKLVYGRMTGWGQEGPYARMAGHDINYIALAGALEPIGRAGGAPVPPLNLVGDFGGGGMFLAFGIACGLIESQRSGLGQVIDAAMVDGAAALTTIFHGLRAADTWHDVRGTNILDSGAPFYDTYETSDGKYVAFGAIEPQFYALFLSLTGLDGDPRMADQLDAAQWPAMKTLVAQVVRQRTRNEWCQIMEGTDVCFAPVLSMGEATQHPHNVDRGTFTEVAGIVQPSPAPRFSRTPASIDRGPVAPGTDTNAVLAEWLGVNSAAVDDLRSEGVVS